LAIPPKGVEDVFAASVFSPPRDYRTAVSSTRAGTSLRMSIVVASRTDIGGSSPCDEARLREFGEIRRGRLKRGLVGVAPRLMRGSVVDATDWPRCVGRLRRLRRATLVFSLLQPPTGFAIPDMGIVGAVGCGRSSDSPLVYSENWMRLNPGKRGGPLLTSTRRHLLPNKRSSYFVRGSGD